MLQQWSGVFHNGVQALHGPAESKGTWIHSSRGIAGGLHAPAIIQPASLPPGLVKFLLDWERSQGWLIREQSLQLPLQAKNSLGDKLSASHVPCVGLVQTTPLTNWYKHRPPAPQLQMNSMKLVIPLHSL